MNKLKRIMVGVDFSPSSLDAVHRARTLAAANGAEVELITVVDRERIREIHELTEEPLDRLESLALRDQTRHLREFVEDAKIPAESVACHVELGSPLPALLKRTRQRAVDLVVLGRYGRGSTNAAVGSLASKVVRKLPTKVLLVARGATQAPQRVVACVDLSSNSRGALNQAIVMAHVEHRPLEIINVVPAPWTRVSATVLQMQEHQRLARERLKVFLHGLGGVLAELEVVQQIIVDDDAARALVSSLSPFDLAVLCTRGRTAEHREMLIGATAERVVRDAGASILAVKPEGFDYGGS